MGLCLRLECECKTQPSLVGGTGMCMYAIKKQGQTYVDVVHHTAMAMANGMMVWLSPALGNAIQPKSW